MEDERSFPAGAGLRGPGTSATPQDTLSVSQSVSAALPGDFQTKARARSLSGSGWSDSILRLVNAADHREGVQETILLDPSEKKDAGFPALNGPEAFDLEAFKRGAIFQSLRSEQDSERAWLEKPRTIFHEMREGNCARSKNPAGETGEVAPPVYSSNYDL